MPFQKHHKNIKIYTVYTVHFKAGIDIQRIP